MILQNGLMHTLQFGSEALAIAFPIVAAVLVIAVSYLLGSINSAIIVSKLVYHDDVRKYGSGNPGTTNMLRAFGKKAALLTLIGDMLKTVISILFAGLLFGFHYVGGVSSGDGLCYIAGMFAILGHIFPIYYRFKGGKGVLCVATAVCMLSPATFIALFVIFAIIVLGMKYVSLGSIVAVMAYPIILDRLNGHSVGTFIAFIIAVIVVYNHRENIKRLLEHKENRLSIGKKDKSKDEEK